MDISSGDYRQRVSDQTAVEGGATRQEIFLSTKLHIPRSRSSYVERPALMARLQQGLEGTLTLLSAPAGSGKTTLLAHWLHLYRQPCAWLSLEAEENDPARFFLYLITTLQTIHAGVGSSVLALIQSTPSVLPEQLMRLLSNELALSNISPFVLVLDDYHLIENELLHTALLFLLSHMPQQMHLVMMTRVDPPFPLTRLRASGQLTELRAPDLRLSRDEVQLFLRRVAGLQPDGDVVATIESRTEGWITGVQLAALSLRSYSNSRSNPRAFLQAFRGNHRFILDYLSEEVFLRQSPGVQDFLLATSILERLHGALCNAVTEAQTGQAMLESLEKANLFVVMLDETREWYRYHQLFAEVLRIRLHQSQPDRLPVLHLRASRWYEQQGFIVDAIQHAVSARDFTAVMTLLEAHGFACVLDHEIPTLVLEWLDVFPSSQVQAYPHLCLLQTIAAIFASRNDAALLYLNKAEELLQNSPPDSQLLLLQARAAACRALIHFACGEIEQSTRFAREALTSLPETDETLRSHVRQCAIRAYRMSGDVGVSTERLTVNAVGAARLTANRTMLLLSMSNLAWIQILRGRLHQAAATYREMARLLPEQRAQSLGAQLGEPNYYIGFGHVQYSWNDLEAAERQITHGLTLLKRLPLMNVELLTLGYITIAQIHKARGAYSRAIEALDELQQFTDQHPFPASLLLIHAATRAEVELAAGNIETATLWADSEAPSLREHFDYSYERAYVAWVHVRLAQKRLNPEQVDLSEVLRVLHSMRQDAEKKMRTRTLLEAAILYALTYDQLGKSQEALSELERALKISEPEDHIRLLADEGPPMMRLLSQMQTTHPRRREYLQQLSIACALHEAEYTWQTEVVVEPAQMPSSKDKDPILSTQAIPDPLSERELEVLQLIAEGASNNDIAEKLVIAVSTVKRHVTNIFAKLAVTNRTQAAARARQLGFM